MKHIEESDVHDVTIHHFSSFGHGDFQPEISMGPSHRLLVETTCPTVRLPVKPTKTGEISTCDMSFMKKSSTF